MLHAHAELGSPSTSASLAKLLGTASYNIGGHLFSLSEIEHCILRFVNYFFNDFYFILSFFFFFFFLV